MKKRSRRVFLRLIVSGIAVIFLIIWEKISGYYLMQNVKKTRIFPYSKNKPVTFLENVIIVNKGEETTVFSSRCSHLGCLINRFEDGKLVCPCHGSEYNMEGKVLKGPAYKNLEVLKSEITDDGLNIEIIG